MTGTAGAAGHSVMLTGILALNSPSRPFPTGPQLSCRVNLKRSHGASWMSLIHWESFHICLCLFCTLQHWHSHLCLFSCLAPLLPGKAHQKSTVEQGGKWQATMLHTIGRRDQAFSLQKGKSSLDTQQPLGWVSWLLQGWMPKDFWFSSSWGSFKKR